MHAMPNRTSALGSPASWCCAASSGVSDRTALIGDRSQGVRPRGPSCSGQLGSGWQYCGCCPPLVTQPLSSVQEPRQAEGMGGAASQRGGRRVRCTSPAESARRAACRFCVPYTRPCPTTSETVSATQAARNLTTSIGNALSARRFLIRDRDRSSRGPLTRSSSRRSAGNTCSRASASCQRPRVLGRNSPVRVSRLDSGRQPSPAGGCASRDPTHYNAHRPHRALDLRTPGEEPVPLVPAHSLWDAESAVAIV